MDTLLQFEEELSQERLDEYLNEILEKARTGNREEAEAMLQKQLHTYPSSSARSVVPSASARGDTSVMSG